jgi:hypothetical protein
MRGRRQEISALAVALGLHAVALCVLRFSLRESSEAFRLLPSRSTTDLEIELADTPVAELAGVGKSDAPSVRGGELARLVPRAKASPEEHRDVEPEMGDVSDAARDQETDGQPAADVGQNVARKPIDLGLGSDGWQRWVTAPKAGEMPRADRRSPRKNRFQVFRARPASTTGGLQEGLEESDRALGLGPHGRVLSALHDAAHSTVAPEAGVARFEVTVHRTGAVEVALGAASGQTEQWKQVAARIAKDLRAAPPRLPPSREGLRLVVELVAEWTLPNGTKVTELESRHLEVPPLKFQSTEEAVEQTKRDNPTTENPTADSIALKLDTPGVYLAERGTVCSYSAGLGAIAPGYRLGAAAGPTMQGACDPSHVGATSQRMVRARVVDQSMF